MQKTGSSAILKKSKEFLSYLPNSKKRKDARLSGLENCYAVLQYPRKSMEGFFYATYAAVEGREALTRSGNDR